MTKISSFVCRMGWLRPSLLTGALAVVWLAFSAGSAPAMAQSADSGYVVAQLTSFTPRLKAYGQVEPIASLPLTAAQGGVIAGLKVLPGMHVRAGEELAHLNGPSIRALLMQSNADVRSAQAQLNATEKFLAIQREQLLSHLSTRSAVHQAESAAAQAQTAFDNAQARLTAVRQMATVYAPADSIVLALNSSNGELVTAGQPIVTLQPSNSLWVKATFYGPDLRAIHTGMIGYFSPADGSENIPIKVRATFGSTNLGGGESIAVVPLHSGTRWLNGEPGTVSLNAPQRQLVSVPTRALILDQGKWWVMVHSAKGNSPETVVPGSTLGWNTFLESGLAPGTKVIVDNAYLLFHASIAEQFQIPD